MDWEKWAAVVGAGTGIVGMVTGGLGLRAAAKSNDIARSGNTIARDANGIATDANRKSDAANQISQEALALSQHQDQRDTEVHDVRWDGDWTAPGRYALVTHGSHAAHEVTAEVTIDGTSVRETRASVAPGELIVFEFPDSAREYAEELRAYREAQQRPRSHSQIDDMQRYMHSFSAWVKWRTPLGAPKEQEIDRSFGPLGDFD